MADRAVKITLRGDISDYNRAMLAAAAGTKAFTRTLDTSTDKMSNLTQTALAIGPALIPIGAAGIPALSGLANQLAFATAGAGVAAIAFNGVGDALQAVNAYAIEPTDANLQALAQTMQTLAPAGREFVMFLQEMRPQMQELQNIAQAGLFPGLQAGISDLLTLMPKFEGIVDTIAQAMGDISAEAGANLAGGGWTQFFDFLEAEARPTLITLAQTMGNFARGFAELWMAFDPLSDQFSSSFLQMSRDFSAWADGLSSTQGFQDFLAYVSDVGPKAWDALGAIGNALLQVVQAAAPVGAVALPVIEALADALAAFVSTPAGPALILAASGLAALSRAVALYNVANGSALLRLLSGAGIGASLGIGLSQSAKQLNQLNAAAGVTAPTLGRVAISANQLKTGLKFGAVAGGLALAMSDLDNKMGLANTTMGATAGLMVTGGPWGAAIGGAIGLALDFAAANDSVGESLDRASAAANNNNLSVQQRIAAIDAEIAAVKRLRAEKQLTAGTVAQSEVTGGTSTRGPDTGAEDAALKQLAATKRDLARASQDATFAEFGFTGAMRGASQATRDETFALLENVRAKQEAAAAAVGAFNAETQYREALKAARDQAAGNNAGIDGMSAAALKNRAIIGTLAGAWNTLATSGEATQGQMKSARAAFIAVAEDMGLGSKRARKLADDLLGIPDVDPRIKVIDNAKQVTSAVKRYLKSIKDEEVIINIIRHHQDRRSGRSTHPGPMGERADGGYIAGPGGPRDDAIPAWLSNGEYVINAAATKRFMPLLDKINAQKYANGGPVPQPLNAGSFATALAGDAAPAASAVDFEAAMNRVFDRRQFDARLSADGRRLQLTMRRG